MKKTILAIAGVAALATIYAFVNKSDVAPVTGGDSGPAVGANLPAFEPTHVTGPDAGTETCPVCKYGSRPAVQAWINGADEKDVKAIVKALEGSVKKNDKVEMKAFVMFIGDAAIAPKLKELAKDTESKNVALTYLPKSSPALGDYSINTDAEIKSTVLVYKDRVLSQKFVNLEAKDIAKLEEAIAKVTK